MSDPVVRRISATEYRALSRSRPGVSYPVIRRNGHWACGCPAFVNQFYCAHVRAVANHNGRLQTPLCDRCGAELRQVTRRYAGNDYRTGWECTRWWENPETGQLDTCATAA